MTAAFNSLWQEISAQITLATNKPFAASYTKKINGGCINSTYLLQGNNQQYFVKLNSAERLLMFEVETAGLAEISRTGTVRVPQTICFGCNEDTAWLVLEYIEMGPSHQSGFEQLGSQLAHMHQVTSAKFGCAFGWYCDNTIGSTPQINTRQTDWCTFWREQRLKPQLQLALANGHHGRLQTLGERLLSKLEVLFIDHHPQPSLLHGDLWSGNIGFDTKGNPVIFDPAVYYGDREADIAMTELFGGFPSAFYEQYQSAYVLAEGYETRKTLYNLYHILNHLNLFGSGYLTQAERMIEMLLANVN